MNAAQHAVYADIMRTRGGTWFHGPYDALLLQPRLAAPAQQLGEFVRFHTSLDARLSELAILLVAVHCRCEVEWYQHAPIAARTGLAASTIDALLARQEPDGLTEDETLVYHFTRSLLERHRVPDELYAQAQQQFGIGGVVELTGLIGYYTFLAFTLNAHQIDLPTGAKPVFNADDR